MATKKVARPLVQKIALLTQELHTPEDGVELSQAERVERIRQSLNDDGICLLPTITDCQWSETAHGDTVTVMVELTLIDATSGDLVTMSWAGQAHGQGDHLVDVASDRALEGALLRAFALHSFVALAPAPAPAPPEPTPSAAPVEAVEVEAPAKPAVQDEPEALEEDEEPAVEEDATPDEDADEDEDGGEDDEAADDVQEDAADDEVEDDDQDAAVAEQADDTDDADDVEDVEEDEGEDLEDEEDAQEEAEDEPTEEDAAPAPVGFSQDPLWNEYYEAMLDSLEGLDGQEGFFTRLAQLRGVDHIHWLSPEQLQLELNALDEFGYEEDYLLNPVRDLFVGGEQFMDALQRATSGQAALEFRALYLERMDAGLLTDVEERKLQAMVKKLTAMNPDARAEYIETVLAEER